MRIDNDWFYSGEEFQLYFQSSGRSLVLKANPPYFTMLAASDNYLSLVHKQRSELLGKQLFEVFPGNAADPSEKNSVISSFNRVITNKTKDVLPVFKYEIFVPEKGTMVTEYWSNVNEPIFDKDGKVAYLINTTANVTQELLNQEALQEAGKQKEALLREQALNEELAAANEELNSTNDELQQVQEDLYKLNAELEERVAARTKSLEEREEKLKLAIETGKMATWSINPSTYKVTMSDYIKEIFGLPVDEEVQMEAIMQAVHPEYRQPLTDLLTNAMQHHQPSDIEYAITNYKTKETKWVRATGKVFLDAQGQIGEYSGLLIDTTDSVNAREYLKNKFKQEQELNVELAAANEEQNVINQQLLKIQAELQLETAAKQVAINRLEANEANIRNMVRQAPVGMCIVQGDPLFIVEANDIFLELIGKRREQFYNTPYWDVNAEAKAYYKPITDEVLKTGTTYHANEHAIVLIRNGVAETVHVNFVYEPMKDEHGASYAIMIVAIDVTEQVNARNILYQLNTDLATSNEELIASNEEQTTINEELQQAQNDLLFLNKQLTESEQRFRILVQQAPVAVFILNSRKLVIEVMNDLMLTMLGKTADIIGKTYIEALPEFEGQPFFQLLDDVFTSGEPFYGNELLAKIEHNGELTDGYFNFIYQPVKDDQGVTHSVICVSVDITEQVKARKKVEQAEESLRMATESAELGTWYLHSQTLDFIVSPRFKQIFGFELNETLSYNKAFSCIHPDYQQFIANAVQDSFTKEIPFNVSYPILNCENGKEKWIRSIGKSINPEDSSGVYITGVIADITEQKLDEQRKNDFIGMVSHELKTPLTSMSGYLQLLQVKAKKNEDDSTATMLDKANKQVNKMTTLINGFLNVSRLEAGKIQIDKHRFNMADLMKEAEEETLSIITSHPIIFKPVDPVVVNADRDKIGQVISNLISNAVKYSAANSTIQVACIIVNGTAQVSVKDEGIGIQNDDKNKLFERYYRVRDNKTQSIAGFGIGLYLCAEIVHRHDGNIWVESEWGKGSTFYFSLPVLV